jgi:hypothetical protein
MPMFPFVNSSSRGDHGCAARTVQDIFGYCEKIIIRPMSRESAKAGAIMSERKQRAITSDKVDQTKPAFVVVDMFGGLTKFCEENDFSAGTVHGWLVNGLIPSRKREHPEHGEISYQAWILLNAERLGVKLEPRHFIEQPIAA